MSADNFSSLRVVSKNVRYATWKTLTGEKSWSVRKPFLCAELHSLSFSVENTFLCLQEVLHSQLEDILACLGPGRWGYIGVGRSDGKESGEYSPVFYRKDVFELDESSYTWLSETRDVPSKSWGAGSIRILTQGKFTHKASGKKIMVMSTHLDNQSALARLEAVKIILEIIAKELSNDPNRLCILGGDFNSEPSDDAYEKMIAVESKMMDARLAVPEHLRYGYHQTFSSFQSFDKADPPALIDFIFYNKSSLLTPRTYMVMQNKYGDEPYNSDHRAVVVDMTL